MVTRKQLLVRAKAVSRDADTAVAYLFGLGYRITFAGLDRYGVSYWHLWVGKTPILMSSDTIRQRARIEVIRRTNPLLETLGTSAITGLGLGAGFFVARKVLRNPRKGKEGTMSPRAKPRYFYEVRFEAVDGTIYTVRVIASSAKEAIAQVKPTRVPGLLNWSARRMFPRAVRTGRPRMR